MLGTDLRYTFRWLARQKASSGLIALVLALGIGANVVVFSLVNALFLRPFPFPQPDRLVYINETAPKWNLDLVGINYPDFHQWHSSAQMFEAIGLYSEASLNLSDGNQAERISGGERASTRRNGVTEANGTDAWQATMGQPMPPRVRGVRSSGTPRAQAAIDRACGLCPRGAGRSLGPADGRAGIGSER